VAEAAVLVGFQETAAGVTAGQTDGTELRTTTTIIGVRREVGAAATAAPLPRLAEGTIAAVGVVRAGLAIRATRQGIGADIDAETAAVGQVLRTGAEPSTDLILVASRPRATAFLGALATGLVDESAGPSRSGPLLAADRKSEQRASEQLQRTTTRRQLANTTRQVIEPPVVHRQTSLRAALFVSTRARLESCFVRNNAVGQGASGSWMTGMEMAIRHLPDIWDGIAVGDS
jgi:hypothetical protein